MTLDPHIFRAYDIRGKALTQLTLDAAEHIGLGFGTALRRMYNLESPRVAVGRDSRTHSIQLEDALVDGLTKAGCTVLLIGETPSPVNYFTICNANLDGGVQVTASHNGPEDNGLKLQIRNAEAYAGEQIQQLKGMIEAEDYDIAATEGETEEIDAITPYLERMKNMFAEVGTGKIIGVDTGNGVAGPVYCDAFEEVGAQLTQLYIEPDGTFPNHPADPSQYDTLVDLQEAVQNEDLDCGFAFDGDGDRLGVIDETGAIRTADEVILLLARDHLSRNPGSSIVFTVSNSSTLDTEVKKWGGKPVMCKVGHSFVEHVMQEHGSLLGGEQSGHFFCGENYFSFDDAMVTALWILKMMHDSGKTLSELCADFPPVFQEPEIRPHCDDDKKTAVVQSVVDHFSATHDVITLDGARIDFGNGAWTGIRQSNTSPKLSICMEARSQQELDTMKAEIMAHMQTYDAIQW